MPETFSLESLGALPELYAAVPAGLQLARVSISIRDDYRVLTASGELHAQAAGSLLYLAARQADLPAVGDWVAVREVAPGEAIVHEVLPRRTQFSRRAAGTREDEQIIAANVDTVFLVSGLDHDFNLRRIERYLTLAHESGARPVLVLNKADLCSDIESHLASIHEIAPDVPAVAISARSAEGILPVLAYLGPGRTIALLGSSGVGKSTLLNQILGTERQRTLEVRESDSRGRHTTTHRELIPLAQGGALIDNPGMRELQLWASEESLDDTFSDVSSLAAVCRFPDCAHQSEPGCAVREALESGLLSAARWSSYTKLRAEIRFQERKANPSAAAAEKQRWKAIHKAQRDLYKRRS